MKEVVFNKSPKLSPKEKRIADMHSVFNILNVLVCELSLLADRFVADQAAVLTALENEVAAIGRELSERENLEGALSRVRKSEQAIVGAFSELSEECTDGALRDEILESLANIKSIYGIVHKRLDEIEARADNPDLWVSLGAKEFERKFRDVFYAIEKNAKGRYRIFFNLARKTKGDYYIDLRIDSAMPENKLWVPLRLVDVLRDLTANARKYTAPGGKVALAIYQGEQEIQAIIEDSGCGIPEDEIERVVEFGYRASNVRDRPTMGGGFGLTKAAWLVHHWGGSLSIETAEGEGTIVRLTLPNKVIVDEAEATETTENFPS